ncbi:MAG: sulfurtransferase complex subunit TusB [Thermoleophilia bacterium]|nr:sulfurtransferase complex subunit TusB [Thermoleophilia bacterium]
MLHLINKSPFESMSLEDCLKYANKGASILLYEDGIYAAMPGTAVSERMAGVTADYKVYALKEDMMLRGVDKVMDGVTEIDYAGFVGLVEESKTASW